MEHAHKLCKSNQISTIYIMVDPNARGFYEKMGFELEFTRSGYKHNTSFHYLRKNL